MIPSKIRLKRRVVYDVVYQDTVDGNPHLDGLCVKIEAEGDAIIRQIILRKGMSKSETERAFIHELLHAVQFEWDIKIPHALIYLLEAPIHKILKLNGWL